ncbi:MAG: hypothetical protein R3E67_05535 [Pseudomonadales bacterium]
MPTDYRVQLTTGECRQQRVASFHCWLDEKLQEPDAVFRPYSRDNGGVAERWHLSCKSVADHYEHLLHEEKMCSWLVTQDVPESHYRGMIFSSALCVLLWQLVLDACNSTLCGRPCAARRRLLLPVSRCWRSYIHEVVLRHNNLTEAIEFSSGALAG